MNPLRSVSCMLLFALTACSIARAADEESKAEKAKSKLTIAKFTLDEDYPEGPGQPGVFGDLSPNLSKIIERIDKAAADEKIFGILLRVDEAQLGRGKVDELRAAIARARKAGKKVYADLHETTSGGYLLASACDEIIMPPVSILTVAGVRMEIMYFKGLLEKLGIQADLMQVGDYKGAAEPFTRDRMSPEFREQTELVIDDYFNQLIETIAADRKLDSGKVKDLVDEGLFTAARAKQAGLIDHVAYVDDFRAQLATAQKVNEVVLAEDYGKKKIDDDFSGFGGLVKLFEMMSGVEPRGRTSANKKIAVIYAVGQIMSGESRRGLTGSALGSDTIIEALRDAEDDPKVVAIVLRVDSPGGSAVASDLIWREITRIKASKPVVASMGDIAASGGYYISMGCTKIFAEPGTLTGSIGVITGKFAVKGLYEKFGLSTDVISRGKNSGWMSSDEPFTESEREVVTRLMHDVYKQFTEKAADGRKMDLKDLDALAGGRLYSGRMAKQSKLVDELGTLEDAVAEAKRLAGLKDDDKVDRILLPKPKTFFEELFGGQMVSSSVQSLVPDLIEPLGRAQQLRALLAEPAVLLMPYMIHVR